MKYDIICSGMWIFLKNSFSKELAKATNEEFAKAAIIKAHENYKDIIKRTEGIGGLRKNSLTINLINCAMLIALYKSVRDKVSSEQMGEIYINAMKNNSTVKLFYRTDIFSPKWQTKRKALSDMSMQKEYKNDWVGEFVYGKDSNDFRINYTECGICKLCKQENCFELAKEMCKFDYVSVDMMGGELERTKTIANGDRMCDFHFIKKQN